jgi:hypothetical protein
MSDQTYPRASGDPTFGGVQQIFAEIGGSGPNDQDSFETRGYTWQSSRCSDGAQLWRIQSRQRGVLRSASSPATSLTRKEITDRLAAGSGGGESPDYNGQFPLEISVSTGRGVNYTFRADANQPIEVYGTCIDATVLVSENYGIVTAGNPVTLTSARSPAIWADALVEVDFQRVDEPITDGEIYYTQIVGVSVGGADEIRIPPRAVAVEITTAQTVAAWGSYIGDPAISGKQTQSIAFTGGVANVELGNETHLQTDIAAVQRQFQLRWTIKP